jgi:urease accessory protein
MAITTTDTALLRLLQLSSAALPVGGYSFSQGLEYAIEEEWLCNSDDVSQWLSFQLSEALVCVDLPLLQRQIQATRSADVDSLIYWNAYTLACRETSELRLTDTAMGAALVKLLNNLSITMPVQKSQLGTSQEITFVTAFAVAAAHWQLETRVACHGYIWSWLENQVAAATKLVPLGQTNAQQLLSQLMAEIPAAIDRSETLSDDAIGASLPALAMASAWHETQYTRLFRS